MPFPSPAIITQDEVNCLTMASSKESSQANSVHNKLQVPPFQGNLCNVTCMEILYLPQNSRSKWSHTGSGTVHWWKSILARLLARLLPNHPTQRSCSRLFSSPVILVKKVLTWHIPFMFKNWDPLSPLLESPLDLRITRNNVSILVYILVDEILRVCGACPDVVTLLYTSKQEYPDFWVPFFLRRRNLFVLGLPDFFTFGLNK